MRDRQTGMKATRFNPSTSDPWEKPPTNVEDHSQLMNGGQIKTSIDTAQLGRGYICCNMKVISSHTNNVANSNLTKCNQDTHTVFELINKLLKCNLLSL